MTDSRCVAKDEGATLLMRVGRELVRLTGNGFLQIRRGKAHLVPVIRLAISQLWHVMVRDGQHLPPTFGDPKDFPYGIVADKDGNLYGIRGLRNSRSVQVWNFETRQFESIAIDKFPLEVSRKLASSNAIELTGFDAVPQGESFDTVRPLKALFGNGIVYLTRQVSPGDNAPEGCPSCPTDGVMAVARVLEFPNIAAGQDNPPTYSLKYGVNGLSWVQDT